MDRPEPEALDYARRVPPVLTISTGWFGRYVPVATPRIAQQDQWD